MAQIQRHIAESYAEYMAGKYYVYGVAANLELASMGNGLDGDGTKLFCTTMAKNVADRAIQVNLWSTSREDCTHLKTRRADPRSTVESRPLKADR